jgi:hypothetical protein
MLSRSTKSQIKDAPKNRTRTNPKDQSLAIVTDGIYRASFLGGLTIPFFLSRYGLLKDVPFVKLIRSKMIGSDLMTQLTSHAGRIDVKSSSNT